MDNNLKTNKNAGMTLLEVIIAVSIFSIAAMILLRGFVTGSRINRKSNLYLEATSTAQNVMEEIKARPFEDVALAFNYPIDQTTGECRFTFLNPVVYDVYNGEVGIKEVMKDGNEYKDIRLYRESDKDDESMVTASVISKDNGKTAKFNPKTEGKYFFQMTNVRNLHETFDILTEFDGGKESGYRKKTSTNNEEGKNDYLAPNIAKLDTKSNAFLIMGKDWDRNAMVMLIAKQLEQALKLWNEKFDGEMDKWIKDNTKDENVYDENGTFVETVHHPTPMEITEQEALYKLENPEPEELDYDDVYANTKRILRITLEEGNNGTPVVVAHYALSAYDYVKEGGSEFERMNICEYCGEDGTNKENIENERPVAKTEKCCCTCESGDITFYSAEADDELKNVYVFYFPNYNSKSGSDPLDDLRFQNAAGIPVTFNLTKERDEREHTLSSVEELGYRMNLTVMENLKGSDPNWNANIGLYKSKTKLKTNLDYDISEIEDIANRIAISQMHLVYRECEYDSSGKPNYSSGRSTSGIGAKNILSFNGLDDRKVSDRIYTAVVKVYKKGAAEKGFPKEDLIVSLDGAKEN